MILALCSSPRMKAKSYIAALPAVIEHSVKSEYFGTYITDAIRLIAENTANISRGKYMAERYYDCIHPKKQDTRTGDEIVEDIIKRAGLVVKSE